MSESKAGPCKRIDPRTGEVIEIVKRQPAKMPTRAERLQRFFMREQVAPPNPKEAPDD
jgi:P pilus assembly chaperone PapD